jgi:hypothetical protein
MQHDQVSTTPSIDNGNKLLLIVWDVRKKDNSVIGIAEFKKTIQKAGWIMHIWNISSLVDIRSKKKYR